MRDPFPIPPPRFLVDASKPLADFLSLPALPLHVHEILFAVVLYTFIDSVVSPFLSNLFVPRIYGALTRRGKVNWDVHVTSFFQSVFISALSLYAIFYDEERNAANASELWEERLWGYTGLSGLVQSLATGYFIWDLALCAIHIDIFGVGMLAHAISAVSVYSFGYRPFVVWYAPVFLMYELSSPFLNIHWFCDKLGLTGSIYQLINGAFLTATFFGCRLVFGIYSSFRVNYDIYRAVRAGHWSKSTMADYQSRNAMSGQLAVYYDEKAQVHAFAGKHYVPLWLVLIYLTSNIILNSLNVFWFQKMIETIRRRFDPPFGTKGVRNDPIRYEPEEKSDGKIAINVGEAGEQLHAEISGEADATATGKSPKKASTRSRRKA